MILAFLHKNIVGKKYKEECKNELEEENVKTGIMKKHVIKNTLLYKIHEQEPYYLTN